MPVSGVDVDDDLTVFFAFHQNMAFASNQAGFLTKVLTGRTGELKGNLRRRLPYQFAPVPADVSGGSSLWLDVDSLLEGFQDYTAMLPSGQQEFVNFVQRYGFSDIYAVGVGSVSGRSRIRFVCAPNSPWFEALRGNTEPIPPDFVAPTGALKLASFAPPDSLFLAVNRGCIAAKWAALKALLINPRRFDFAGEAKESFAEIEEQFGVTLDALAATLGDECAAFLPVPPEIGRADEDSLTLAFTIKDREAFDALLDQALAAPFLSGLATRRELQGESIEGATVLSITRDGKTDGPALALIDDVLLLSGDRRAMIASLKAHAAGRDLLTAAGVHPGDVAVNNLKIFALRLAPLLMEDRASTPLLDLLRPNATLTAIVEESQGGITITLNHSLPSLVALIAGGEVLSRRFSGERAACLSNLREIGAAIAKYRSENGEDPASLEALVPDYLPAARLVCPLDREQDVTCSYEHLLKTKRDHDHAILAFCPHRLHRRVVLYQGGYASTAREDSFQRQLREDTGSHFSR